MPDPGVVAGVVARGARAAQSAKNEAEHGGSPFDVWTHTGEGQAGAAAQTALMTDMPVAPIESGSSVGAVPGAIAQQVGALKRAAAGISEAKGALATVGAVMNTLTTLEQAISIPLSAIPFPAYPAIRVLDMDVGLPHAHNHPPNFIPPAPPVPLPSTGPVIPLPYVSGAATVMINGMPAGRCGDMGMGIWCGSYFPMYEIFLGSSSVWIEGMRAARLGVDITKHCIFSHPKPNDPPVGPMVGMTVSASVNVIIGGVPMPSLTNMAVGVAMKWAFKGLGKIVGRIRAAKAAQAAAEAEAKAAAEAEAKAAAEQPRAPKPKKARIPPREYPPEVPPERFPRSEAEYNALAEDPAHRGVPPDPKARQERSVGIGLENIGEPDGVAGPITRDPNPKGGEFIDAKGQVWDVKTPTSRPPPGHPQAFDAAKYADQFGDNLAKGENVMVDTTDMSAADRAALEAEVADRGWGKDKIKWWPP